MRNIYHDPDKAHWGKHLITFLLWAAVAIGLTSVAPS